MTTSMPANGPFDLGPPVPEPGDHPSNMNALGPLNYDITPDAREFVLTRRVRLEPAANAGSIDVVLNWVAEMTAAPKQ
jgi:hypothetical protein